MHPDPICQCSHQYGEYCTSNDGHHQHARAFAGQDSNGSKLFPGAQAQIRRGSRKLGAQ